MVGVQLDQAGHEQVAVESWLLLIARTFSDVRYGIAFHAEPTVDYSVRQARSGVRQMLFRLMTKRAFGGNCVTSMIWSATPRGRRHRGRCREWRHRLFLRASIKSTTTVAVGCVERGGRLIEQQDRACCCEATRNIDALLFTARKRRRRQAPKTFGDVQAMQETGAAAAAEGRCFSRSGPLLWADIAGCDRCRAR